MTNFRNVLNYKCKSLSNCGTNLSGGGNYTQKSYAWTVREWTVHGGGGGVGWGGGRGLTMRLFCIFALKREGISYSISSSSYRGHLHKRCTHLV